MRSLVDRTAFSMLLATTVAVCLYVGETFAPAPAVAAVKEVAPQGTAPPPYTDPNITITNALGGMGRVEGWNQSITAVDGTRDALAAAAGSIPLALRPLMTSGEVTSSARRYTITLVSMAGATGALCFRLGPTTDGDGVTPAASCGNTNFTGVQDGGCYLWIEGQSCMITIRPIKTCDGSDYTACHIPIWVTASPAATGAYHVGVAW